MTLESCYSESSDKHWVQSHGVSVSEGGAAVDSETSTCCCTQVSFLLSQIYVFITANYSRDTPHQVYLNTKVALTCTQLVLSHSFLCLFVFIFLKNVLKPRKEFVFLHIIKHSSSIVFLNVLVL